MVQKPGQGQDLRVVLAKIGTAILLKFMLGSDDLVWLSPYMAQARSVRAKLIVGFKYVLSVLSLTALACYLAVAIHEITKHGSSQEIVERVVSTIAGSLLAIYAINMAREEGYCGDEAENEDDGIIQNVVETSLEYIGFSGDENINAQQAHTPKRDVHTPLLQEEEKDEFTSSKRSVVVVAILGSMDDFFVYFAVAVAGQLSAYELMAGVTIGAFLIALIVGVLLQSSRILASYIELIPVPFVLLGLSVFILIETWAY